MKFIKNNKSSKLNPKELLSLLALTYVLCFVAVPCMASLESSLMGLQSKLTGFVLPVLSVIGLLFAGFSFLTGSEKAKQHILYAVIGCAIGFGAQAIVDFMASTVH